MSKVLSFPTPVQRAAERRTEPAVVVLLPVVRIKRFPDQHRRPRHALNREKVPCSCSEGWRHIDQILCPECMK